LLAEEREEAVVLLSHFEETERIMIEVEDAERLGERCRCR
jgi:hypothetical protein